MKRKVFEKQIVDLQTGEVVSEEVHYNSNNNESQGKKGLYDLVQDLTLEFEQQYAPTWFEIYDFYKTIDKFLEEEVDKACQRHSELAQFGGEIGSYEHDASDLRTIQKDSYKEGVEYAESQVEDLCIEFATFIENNFITAISSGKKYINFHEEDDLDFTSDSNRYSLEEVFQQFLIQRNGK